MKKFTIILIVLGILVPVAAFALPTSTYVQNLFITDLKTSGLPCLAITSVGLVQTSTCGSGGGGGSSTVLHGVTPIVITALSGSSQTSSCPTCVVGSGTINQLPLWVSTTTLGNSGISYDPSGGPSFNFPAGNLIFGVGGTATLSGNGTANTISLDDGSGKVVLNGTGAQINGGSGEVSIGGLDLLVDPVVRLSSYPTCTVQTDGSGNLLCGTFNLVNSLSSTSTAGGIDFSAATGTAITGILHSLLITQFTGVLAIANGGTNATSAVAALANLGGISTSTYNASITVATAGPLGGGGKLANNGTLTLTCVTCYTGVGANPTAQVGVSAVNGVSTNFMRADGAPALAPQFASSSVTFNLYDATSTAPYKYAQIGFNKSVSIDKVTCSETASGATHVVNLFRATAAATSTVDTTILASISCSNVSTSTQTFSSSTLTAGTWLVSNSTSTTGSPTWTVVTVDYKTL